MSVPIRTTPTLEVGRSSALFTLPGRPWEDFDVSADGKRFLAVVPRMFGGEQPLTVILTWKRKSAGSKGQRERRDRSVRAILYRSYGGPEVLTYEEMPKPTPHDDEVRIRIRAASVNPYDCHFMRGAPFPMRVATGLRRPKDSRLGVDVAGDVETVGRNVTDLAVGDAVFGACRGAFAEYGCAKPSSLTKKPANVSYEQAACATIAGLTALQALRRHARLQAGQTILVNGAAGGVGTFAVQIAKVFGATVVGVCSTRNLEMVSSIGAARVIDYTKEDFTQAADRYDVLLDTISNHSLVACRRVLAPHGAYVIVGAASRGHWLGPLTRLLTTPLMSPFVTQRMVVAMTRSNAGDLATLRALMETGRVIPVIDCRYELHETAEAIRYVEHGHARGKVVVRVA
jgi:NADPH:quinone reductase-like Zn-dependent oxidoreductase